MFVEMLPVAVTEVQSSSTHIEQGRGVPDTLLSLIRTCVTGSLIIIRSGS